MLFLYLSSTWHSHVIDFIDIDFCDTRNASDYGTLS